MAICVYTIVAFLCCLFLGIKDNTDFENKFLVTLGLVSATFALILIFN